MVTKELILKEVESAVSDYCKIGGYNFSYKDYTFEVYEDEDEEALRVLITLTEEDNTFVLESGVIFVSANTQSEEMIYKTVARNEEIQEYLREYQLELIPKDRLLFLSFTSTLPTEISLIKSQTLIHINTQLFHAVLFTPIFDEKLNAEEQIREN